MVRSILVLAFALGVVACNNNFEARSIVLDLRVLGMRSDPAEVVVDVDPANLLSTELPPVATTILLGDPLGPRRAATVPCFAHRPKGRLLATRPNGCLDGE